MFNPEDCIGVKATSYLLDLGFEIEDYYEYVGDEIIDEAILTDDSHPDHSGLLKEYTSNLEVRLRCYRNKQEIIISWSDGDIISHSIGLPDKLITIFESLIYDCETVYVSNEMMAELERNSIVEKEDE